MSFVSRPVHAPLNWHSRLVHGWLHSSIYLQCVQSVDNNLRLSPLFFQRKGEKMSTVSTAAIMRSIRDPNRSRVRQNHTRLVKLLKSAGDGEPRVHTGILTKYWRSHLLKKLHVCTNSLSKVKPNFSFERALSHILSTCKKIFAMLSKK